MILMNLAMTTNCKTKTKPLWMEVDELHRQNIPDNEIRQFIDKRAEQINYSSLFELLDFVSSMRRMIHFGGLNIFESTIKNLLLRHVSKIELSEVWQILEKNKKELIRDALFVLWALLRSEFIIKRILRITENKGINSNVARHILDEYINHAELWGVTNSSGYHGVIFQSDFAYIGWDFFYKLLKLVLKDKYYFKQKSLSKDYFISSFNNIYNSVPCELSEKQLSLLFKYIKNIKPEIWLDKISMSHEDITNFVKKIYKYKNKNDNFSLTETSTDDIESENIKLLGIIFTNTFFKRELKNEIEEFLKNNPVSLYWQVTTMSLECGDDDETVRNFIRDNISKFSYTDIFQRLLNTILGDNTPITLYIILQLKGCKEVLSDIEKNFKKGKIKPLELKHLLRSYYGMLEFDLGVKPDKVFANGLKRIIENN